MKMLINFLDDETGATAIEYGIIAAIMGIGVAGGVSSYGQNVLKLYNNIATAVLDAPTP